jgi:hypothetical protein
VNEWHRRRRLPLVVTEAFYKLRNTCAAQHKLLACVDTAGVPAIWPDPWASVDCHDKSHLLALGRRRMTNRKPDWTVDKQQPNRCLSPDPRTKRCEARVVDMMMPSELAGSKFFTL